MSTGKAMSMKAAFVLMIVLLIAVFYRNYASEPRQGIVISGTVTLDGEILDQGWIEFFVVDGSKNKKSAAEITNGRFSTDHRLGIQPGQYRVEITSYEPRGQAPGQIPVSRIPDSWNSNSTHFITVADENELFEFSIETLR